MSQKSFLLGVAVFAVLFAPLGVGTCRGDFEDQLWEKARRQREAEVVELRREVADALNHAQTLTRSAPEKAVSLLRASLSRLRDDGLLPKVERKQLRERVEERLHGLIRLVATKTEEGKHGPAHPAKTPKGTGQGFGGVGAVLGVNTTVSIPDGGTAVVGGYGSVIQARNELGPPLLSNPPYLGRLSRNVGTGRAVRAYRVLIGVRIISLSEEDERLLGQGASR